MRRDADKASRQASPCRGGIAATRQVHATSAGSDDRIEVLVRGNCRAKAMAARHQFAQQIEALGGWQILLAQAEPAAPRPERRLGDLDERPPRLAAVGDDEEGRVGQVHLNSISLTQRAPTPTLPRMQGRELLRVRPNTLPCKRG